ncbi:hypothetical protein PLICRDRAFT_170106 [Plicaturopsis crispa FD-325 SS-3]|nr:hypothetical protein PLICRDRAFT_170106 [Plicaturopsis crispa FD-325 SS-3]
MPARQPYHGLYRKLVLAFDVGTTYSGVSYAILDPGEVPKINGVNRFPAQETVGGDSKIPTVIYYDSNGVVKAVGAEALQESVIEVAEDEEWTKVEWFKLHFRPQQRAQDDADDWTDLDSSDEVIPPLPPNKTAVGVLADFMRYLFDCTKTYIEETHAGGPALWASVADHIDFILSHPNGWEGVQQSQIRRAAVLAGMVPNTQSGHSRVQFVTEGEASLHFCISNDLASDVIQSGKGVIIVDAGGGTVDLSAYSMDSTKKAFEEIAPTDCLFQGSVYVTRRAKCLLEEKLVGKSKFSSAIGDIIECFDRTTKLRFRNADEPSYIKFGTARDKDPNVNIRSGQLKLPGAEVAALFEPAVRAITSAIEKQRQASQTSIAAVFLVGGFAASDWLFSQLQAYLGPLGLDFCRPDSHVNKAVADGAVSFYIDHFVSVRVARTTYGTDCNITYDAQNPDHRSRSHQVYVDVDGTSRLPHGFYTILSKGTRVSETKEFRKSFCQMPPYLGMAKEVSADILSYEGRFSEVHWTDVEPKKFPVLCTIEADTSGIARALQPRYGPSGNSYFYMEYDIVLLFGLTEMKAQISWKENGQEKRSPTAIVYDGGVAPISIQPYHGLHRKLVLAFDVGTTYSGVSYALLDPGEVPKINGVNRFPAQETVGGDSKIPTVIYYDRNGAVKAVGAEALQESVIELAEDEEWVKVEWFKLHFRPQQKVQDDADDWTDIDSPKDSGTIPPLPLNKTAVNVLADFMRYLLQCTKTYIEETHASGPALWASLADHIDFILSHPNGWEGVQQSQIRQAAVLAGLVPDTQGGHARVQFVTEGEASLHFCLSNDLASDVIQGGAGVIIVDAGGGTVDLSAYSMDPSSKTFEEIAPTDCLFQGSVYVTRRAHSLLEEKLVGKSKYGAAINDITECFDKTTKLRFRNDDEPSYIKFGTARDKDLNVNIRKEVAALFEPAVKGIIDAIERQRKASQTTIAAVLLVGGFAASDWLFARLQAYLSPLGLDFCRPDSHVNKAVADGAVSFYIDHFVSVRVARTTYGVKCQTPYISQNPDHKARSHLAYTDPSNGRWMLPNSFSTILAKGTRVSETKEFRRSFVRTPRSADAAVEISLDLLSYEGRQSEVKWTDAEPNKFPVLCTVEADTRRMARSLQPSRAANGITYYTQEFDVILLFGLTEMKAQISWKEYGEEKRSPATIAYDGGMAPTSV